MRSEGYGSWVCHISPLERVFVLKSTGNTGQNFAGIFLKLLPALYGYLCSPPLYSMKTRMRIVLQLVLSMTEAVPSGYINLTPSGHVRLTHLY